jgi:hypothetical protein
MQKTTAQYLDEIKEKCGLQSDYAVAVKIGTTRNSVSHYRHCKNAFDNHTCLVVSQLLEIPLEQVIKDMEIQREKDQRKKADWLSFERRLRGAAASIVAASIVTLIVAPSPASASNQGLTTPAFDTLQIMRSTRKTVAFVLDTLNRLFRRVCCASLPNAGITA